MLKTGGGYVMIQDLKARLQLSVEVTVFEATEAATMVTAVVSIYRSSSSSTRMVLITSTQGQAVQVMVAFIDLRHMHLVDLLQRPVSFFLTTCSSSGMPRFLVC